MTIFAHKRVLQQMQCHTVWVDAAASALGMDICALDGVHDAATGAFHIIELNDSAAGFVERHTTEDMGFVRDLGKCLMKKETSFQTSEEVRN